MKKILKSLIGMFGYSISKNDVQIGKFLLYEDDSVYKKRYLEGSELSNTPDGGIKRYERFYNLIQFIKYTDKLTGAVAECGVWRGLSSYLICKYIQDSVQEYKGENLFLFDSFQGLSEVAQIDIDPRSLNKNWPIQPGKGSYAAQEAIARATLFEFPYVSFNKGWIPDVFEHQDQRDYRFVHIDVDLHQPILSSLEYFWPKLVKGGVIVVDDYGSLHWPGAKLAVEEFCEINSVNFMGLSTGQAILIK